MLSLLLTIYISTVNCQPALPLIRQYTESVGSIGSIESMCVYDGILFSAGTDRMIRLWSVETGSYITTLYGSTGTISALEIVDGILLSAGDLKGVRRWNISSFTQMTPIVLDYSVGSVVKSTPGRAIFGSIGGPSIEEYDITSRTRTRRFSSWDGPFMSITSLLVVGNTLLSGSQDQIVTKWDLSGNLVKAFEPAGSRNIALAHAQDRVYAAVVNSVLHVWNFNGTYIKSIFNAPNGDYTAFIYTGNEFLFGDSRALKILDVDTEAVTATLLNVGVESILASNSSFFSATEDRIIRKWDRNSRTIMWSTVPGYRYTCITTSLNFVFVGREDGRVQQWSRSGTIVREFTYQGSMIQGLVASDTFLFSASADGSIVQYSVVSGSVVRIFTASTNNCIGLAIRDNFLFTGTWTNARGLTSVTDAVMININSGDLVRRFEAGWQIQDIEIQGEFIFIADRPGSVTQRQISTSELIFTYSGHQDTVRDILVLGDYLITGAADKKVIVWSIQRRSMITIMTLSHEVCSLCAVQTFLFVGTCNPGTSISQFHLPSGVLIRSFDALQWDVKSMYTFGSSLFVTGDGTFKEFFIPNLLNSITTTNLVTAPSETRSAIFDTRSPDTGSITVPTAPSTSQLTSATTITFISLGVLTCSIIVLLLIRAFSRRQYVATSSTKSNTALLDKSSGKGSTTTATVVPDLPTITDVTCSKGLMTISGTTLINDTAELSIPVFLEVTYEQDFTVGDLIGRGGSGTISRCVPSADLYQKHANTPLVVKLLDKALEVMGDKHRHAFIQELALMHKFRMHPNIAHVVGYSMRPVCLIMKYFEMGDFHAYIRGRSSANPKFPYTRATVLRLLRQWCNGVAYIHNNGVVHCDIKPANVLLDCSASGSLQPVITDLGVARIVERAKGLVVEGFEVADLRGASISYAAPEAIVRFRKRLNETDPAIWKSGDTFSLAVSILQAIQRKMPWKSAVK